MTRFQRERGDAVGIAGRRETESEGSYWLDAGPEHGTNGPVCGHVWQSTLGRRKGGSASCEGVGS